MTAARLAIAIQTDPALLAGFIDAGGLVVLPTETVYGLATTAASEVAVGAFRRARNALAGGDTGEAASCWHAASPEAVLRGLDVKAPVHRRLIGKLAPGPVTFAVQLSEAERIAAADRLGVVAGAFMDAQGALVRVPSHPAARAALMAASRPVIAEAIPVSPGGRPAIEIDEAVTALERAGVQAAAALDGGRATLGKPSSLVRLTADGGWDLLQAGPYDREYISRQAERHLLFVCTGNTCRSPMAEAIARGLLAKKPRHGPTSVRSAGVGALDGAGYSPEVVAAVKRLGLEPPRGASRMLTAGLINQADEVYVMTRAHRAAVLAIDPSASAKVRLLDPSGGEVPDPIGAGQERYDQVAAEMKRMIQRRLEEPDA